MLTHLLLNRFKVVKNSKADLNLISPGRVLGKILMGVCRWDSETRNLYQTTFMSFLQPYSRLDAKNPYPIPD